MRKQKKREKRGDVSSFPVSMRRAVTEGNYRRSRNLAGGNLERNFSGAASEIPRKHVKWESGIIYYFIAVIHQGCQHGARRKVIGRVGMPA